MRLGTFLTCRVPRLRPVAAMSCNRSFFLVARSLSSAPDNKKSAQAATEQEKRDKIDVTILKKLTTYLWPKADEPYAFQTKSRIGGALVLLLGSKLINIQVPFIFKHIIDTCSTVEMVNGMDPHVAVPLSMVLGYGLARSTSALMQER